MSDESKKNGFGGLFVDRLKIAAIGGLIWGGGVLLIVLLSPWREQIDAMWHAPARLATMEASLERHIDKMTAVVEDISAKVGHLSGESRVTRVDMAATYVTEPVHVGEPIVLILVAARTELGSICILEQRTALFTDETGIAIAGERVPPALQLTTIRERQRLMLQPPEDLMPGRITVALVFEFSCNGTRVFETTQPVAFRLLPRLPSPRRAVPN